jgi:hypothetical protein
MRRGAKGTRKNRDTVLFRRQLSTQENANIESDVGSSA